MGEEPHLHAAIGGRRQAADERVVQFGDHCGQRRAADPGADGGEDPGHAAMGHGDGVFEAVFLQPQRIISADPPAAAAYQGVKGELAAIVRNAVRLRIGAAAIDGPAIDADASPDKPGAGHFLGDADRDVCRPSLEVAYLFAGIKFDDDVRPDLVQLAQHGRQHADHIGLFRREPDCAAALALQRGGRVRQRLGRGRERARFRQQRLARGGERIARPTPLEQVHAERLLERGDAARDGRLADAQRPSGGQGAAAVSHRHEVARVVPVEHGRILHFCSTALQHRCYRRTSSIA